MREQDTIDPSEVLPTGKAGLSDLVDRVWIDQLVDLQVLAAHGDIEAADAAERWLAHDPEARELWITVSTRCHQARFTVGHA